MTTLTDTDIGIVATRTLPDPNDLPLHHQNLVFAPVADWVRSHIPDAAVWFDRSHVAIRQPHGPDLVATTGDTLAIAAGAVAVAGRAS